MKKFLVLLAFVAFFFLMRNIDFSAREEQQKNDWGPKVAWCKSPVNDSLKPSSYDMRRAWELSEAVLEAVRQGERTPSKQAREDIRKQIKLLKMLFSSAMKAEQKTLTDVRFQWNIASNLEEAFKAAEYMQFVVDEQILSGGISHLSGEQRQKASMYISEERNEWRDLYSLLADWTKPAQTMKGLTFNPQHPDILNSMPLGDYRKEQK